MHVAGGSLSFGGRLGTWTHRTFQGVSCRKKNNGEDFQVESVLGL